MSRVWSVTAARETTRGDHGSPHGSLVLWVRVFIVIVNIVIIVGRGPQLVLLLLLLLLLLPLQTNTTTTKQKAVQPCRPILVKKRLFAPLDI